MSRETQKKRIVAALENGPKTTMQLIGLDICCPTKRISELRREGYDIDTSEERRDGKRIVTYALLSIPEGSNE